MHDENEIRSIPCPSCKVCGFPGEMAYRELSDRLFSAPGLWNLTQCPNKECGLMWLDPMPLEEDIHEAYQTYYTHGENAQKESQNIKPITKVLSYLFQLFLRLTPITKERIALDRMFLVNIKPGKLLEIGCGDGARLGRLSALGWSVEGQEVDPVSAAIAAKRGLEIHLGPLEKLSLPAESYDAIVMNHVIEHVHEPVKLLSECRRLLKAKGTLVSVTPNIRSYGHRIFKANWRGLEPPRHVMLHCQESLRLVAQQAGFENPAMWTTVANANHLTKASLQLICGTKNPKLSIKALYYFVPTLFLLWARIIQIFDKDSGEECVLILRRSEVKKLNDSHCMCV
jgi:2-polyprenyl-3-methyl-5-hydroxy-6-metoxy-1,4-benzoquinol methylase